MNDLKDATLHRRILTDIEHSIVSGEWPPGHRIPFEVELAAQYGCSRMTVNKVLTHLAANGLIERRKKSGSFVTQPRGQAAILEIHDVKSEVEALKLPYRHGILLLQERAMRVDDERRIELKAGQPIVAVKALHFAGERPFCLEDRIISLVAVPEASGTDFEAIPPGTWLVKQVPWSSAEHKIFASSASADIARSLDIPVGAACLVVERRTWLSEQAVTSVRFIYRGDEHSFVARFSPESK